MKELDEIIASNLFDHDQFNDPKHKYFFQIAPAIYYSLQAIVENNLNNEEREEYDTNLETDDYLEIAKKNEILDKVLTDQLEDILANIKEVRSHHWIEKLGSDERIKQLNEYLDNANQYIDDTKNIVNNINVYYG